MEDFEEDSDPGRLYYEQKAMEQDPDYVNWLVELAKQEELDKYSGIYECF